MPHPPAVASALTTRAAKPTIKTFKGAGVDPDIVFPLPEKLGGWPRFCINVWMSKLLVGAPSFAV